MLAATDNLVKQQDVARKKQQLAFEEVQNVKTKEQLALEEENLTDETERQGSGVGMSLRCEKKREHGQSRWHERMPWRSSG